MTLRRWLTVSALAVSLTVVGCTPAPDSGADPAAASVVEAEITTTLAATVSEESSPLSPVQDITYTAGTALAALESLEVKGRAPKTGYARSEFGPNWADVDRNGCDTRNDILARDLRDVTYREGTHDCVVLSGVLDEPYTATEIHFVRGQDTSTDVHIDHVVALSDAWQKGAQQLSEEERTAFANDPLNLLAVDGPANMQKGDGDAATWLPANRAFRCDYVSRQIAVKARYDLWVTQAEKDAKARVLDDCPGQELPTDETAVEVYPVDTTATQIPTVTATTSLAPAPAPAPDPQIQQAGGTDPRFPTCKKAKASGYGPYVQGIDPEYAWYRDADRDGTVCE